MDCASLEVFDDESIRSQGLQELLIQLALEFLRDGR